MLVFKLKDENTLQLEQSKLLLYIKNYLKILSILNFYKKYFFWNLIIYNNFFTKFYSISNPIIK